VHDAGARDLVDDRERDARRGGADDRRDILREEVGDRDGRGVGRGVAGVAVDDLDLDAEIGLVDLLRGEVDAAISAGRGRRERRTGKDGCRS